jgi:hypothetical protein
MSVPNITKAIPHRICRCGCQMEIGSAIVDIGGISVRVEITADGVSWPHGVEISCVVAAEMEPAIRQEWLRSIEAAWASRGAKTR